MAQTIDIAQDVFAQYDDELLAVEKVSEEHSYLDLSFSVHTPGIMRGATNDLLDDGVVVSGVQTPEYNDSCEGDIRVWVGDITVTAARVER